MSVALSEAIDVLLAIEPAQVDDDELHRLVIEVQQQSSRLVAARARLIAEWDSRRVWAANGAATASARLASDAGMSQVTARTEVGRGRRLRTMDHTLKALGDGDISLDHTELLTRANWRWRTGLFAEHEQALVEHCKRLRYADADRAIKYWCQHADAVADQETDGFVDRRTLTARRTLDGVVELWSRLDPVAGTAVLEELVRIETELYRAEQAAGPLTRTVRQRRADALVEMAHRSRTVPSGGRRPHPLITVIVDIGTFTKTVCEIEDGTVVAPSSLLRLLGDAEIERVVFDGPSRVIEVSRKRRFTGALRRAIQVRDRRCQHPSGCDVPANRCDCDHIQPRSERGPTSQDNGRLLCPTHNRRQAYERIQAKTNGPATPPEPRPPP